MIPPFASHYGFTADPFAGPPGLWCDTAGLGRALGYLGFALGQGEGVVVLTGETGSGRTALVAQLLAGLEPARLLSATVSAEPGVVVPAHAFGLSEDPAALEAHALARRREGRGLLLIVTEADLLDAPALAALHHAATARPGLRPLFQLLLVGLPSLRAQLQTPAAAPVRAAIIADHHLDAMTEAETRAYLEQRLRTAGWQGRPRLDDDAWSVIHTATAGLPGAVNALTAKTLSAAADADADTIDAALIDHILVGPVPDPAQDRIALLEARITEQEAALRHLLTLLVDWIEAEQR